MQKLLNVTRNGLPVKQIQKTLYEYSKYQHELTNHDSMLYSGCSIVIPKLLQQEELNKLHVGHRGITGMKSTAR